MTDGGEDEDVEEDDERPLLYDRLLALAEVGAGVREEEDYEPFGLWTGTVPAPNYHLNWRIAMNNSDTTQTATDYPTDGMDADLPAWSATVCLGGYGVASVAPQEGEIVGTDLPTGDRSLEVILIQDLEAALIDQGVDIERMDPP